MIGDWWLKREDVDGIAKKLEIKVVPSLGFGNLQDLEDFVKEAPNSEWGDFPLEGVVARPKVELCTQYGDRVITKLKVKDFKHE